ncbi:MAG: cell division protein FtsZ [Opitutaceae bacterium]|nr:cell division protein FtsZ [Opitutaceae bacterium]
MSDHAPELPSFSEAAAHAGVPPDERPVNIKLIGVGGAGGNAADRLQLASLERVSFASVNTDSQALGSSVVQEKLLIGRGVTRGLGAGGDPELGRLAAESDREAITAMVRNSDLVLLVAGMGGGTGSGAAPVVAEIAAKSGAVVIAFVTMPFTFEGGRRGKQAEDGLIALRAVADAVIPLPNDMLLQQAESDASVLAAFARGDEWIDRAVRSITGMLFRTGLMNLDFASLREIFAFRGGKTLYGLGSGEGAEAVNAAIEDFRNCPLLHTPEFSRKADRLLVNIIGGPDLSLDDVQHIMSVVTEEFGRNPHVAMGAVIDESWKQRVEICVIGTTDVNGRAGRRALPERVMARSRIAGRAQAVEEAAAAKVTPAEREVAEAMAGDDGEGPTTARSARPKTHRAPVQQEEFAFGDAESRGHFDNTDRTIFEGEDLDIPTFRRRGIKIVL